MMDKYSRKTEDMQYPSGDRDDFNLPRQQQVTHWVKTATVLTLIFLGLSILWLGLTATATPNTPRPPASPAVEAGVTEQRLTLTDGRTVLCLTFPGSGSPVTCDWSRAFPQP